MAGGRTGGARGRQAARLDRLHTATTGPRSVSEADWLEFNTEANDYGVPDRAGLQSVIDVIGEHYLHLAREWGWNDTEVRDAMYVETKQRGWCRE